MEAYAVIQTGGKQYRVQQGDVFDIELLEVEEGASVEFDALAVSNGSELTIGAPVVDGAVDKRCQEGTGDAGKKIEPGGISGIEKRVRRDHKNLPALVKSAASSTSSHCPGT